jgi:hypothetical protein
MQACEIKSQNEIEAYEKRTEMMFAHISATLDKIDENLDYGTIVVNVVCFTWVTVGFAAVLGIQYNRSRGTIYTEKSQPSPAMEIQWNPSL